MNVNTGVKFPIHTGIFNHRGKWGDGWGNRGIGGK